MKLSIFSYIHFLAVYSFNEMLIHFFYLYIVCFFLILLQSVILLFAGFILLFCQLLCVVNIFSSFLMFFSPWNGGLKFDIFSFVNIFLYGYLFLKNKFIYIRLRWVFTAERGFSLVAVSGGYSLLRCAGFSLQWLLLLQSTGSRCLGFSSCGTRALEHRLSSCGAWA